MLRERRPLRIFVQQNRIEPGLGASKDKERGACVWDHTHDRGCETAVEFQQGYAVEKRAFVWAIIRDDFRSFMVYVCDNVAQASSLRFCFGIKS